MFLICKEKYSFISMSNIQSTKEIEPAQTSSTEEQTVENVVRHLADALSHIEKNKICIIINGPGNKYIK